MPEPACKEIVLPPAKMGGVESGRVNHGQSASQDGRMLDKTRMARLVMYLGKDRMLRIREVWVEKNAPWGWGLN